MAWKQVVVAWASTTQLHTFQVLTSASILLPWEQVLLLACVQAKPGAGARGLLFDSHMAHIHIAECLLGTQVRTL